MSGRILTLDPERGCKSTRDYAECEFAAGHDGPCSYENGKTSHLAYGKVNPSHLSGCE